jgi:uncharacterized MAPEG superfamily protein
MTTNNPRDSAPARRDGPPAGRAVVIGALAGTVLGWLLFALIVGLFVGPRAAQTADRLAYAAAWLLPVAILLFAMTMATGFGRAVTRNGDPTARGDSRYVDISRRVLTNSVEQSLVFALAALTMGAVTPAGQLGLLGSLTILFVIARIAFWIGYLIQPVYRYAGFALTAEINIVILVWDLVHVF